MESKRSADSAESSQTVVKESSKSPGQRLGLFLFVRLSFLFPGGVVTILCLVVAFNAALTNRF
jgi:hypothetical protein